MLVPKGAGTVFVFRELELCLFLESLNWFFFSEKLELSWFSRKLEFEFRKISHDLIFKTLTSQSVES